MLGDGVRDQMLARDLDLLVLGIAGDPDDLHAVHQRAGILSVFAVVMNMTFDRS